MKTILWNTFLKVKAFQQSFRLQKEIPLIKTSAPPWMIEQIEEDLENVKRIKPTSLQLDRIMADKKSVDTQLLARYQIRNNRITVHSYPSPMFSRVHAVALALKVIAENAEIPDVDFVVTLHDTLYQNPDHIAIFAFAKNSQSALKSILMPDFEALLGYHDIEANVCEGNTRFPWEKKQDCCIWRGVTTGGQFGVKNFLDLPRAKAVALSKKHPLELDALFTRLVQAEDPDALLESFSSYFGPFVSIPDHIRYKYQLLIDGNSCAYSRCYWALLTNCTLIKQDSSSIQWYYRALVPHLHYHPVKHDLSDLIDQIHFLRGNDFLAKKIALAGRLFALENLSYPRILQYFYHLLCAYSKL